jgi:ankyrin repeat protein
MFNATSEAEQVENRGLTRLQQSILGLITIDFDLMLAGASLSDINARDADGNTVLSWAARCGNGYATRRLLAHGACVHPSSRFGSTALHYAAGASSPDCIQPLLKAGADPNTPNACLRETPLHAAALRHDEPESYLEPFLAHGADVNACDHEGSSVLAFAVQANNCRSAAYLLDHGASIDAADEGGLTPLGLAVMYKHHAILELLLERGADVLHATDAAETLLHLCAMYGDQNTVGIFASLSAEIDVDAVDRQGFRAADRAKARGDEEFVRAFTLALLPPLE